MNLVATAFTIGIAFIGLCLVFRPLEMVFPAKKGQKFFRPEWWQDLFFFLGQYLLFSALVLYLLSSWGGWLQAWIPENFREAVRAQPSWLQAVEVVLLSDLFVYWGHRLQHKVPLLWRFHAVHHSAEHLD